MLKHLQSRDGDRTMWERGFTLVELLVVIVILGILAAVVVFAVGGTEENAKVKSCLAERNTLEAAVISYQSAAESNPDLPRRADGGRLEGATPTFLKHDPKYWTVERRRTPDPDRATTRDRTSATTRPTADLNLRLRTGPAAPRCGGARRVWDPCAQPGMRSGWAIVMRSGRSSASTKPEATARAAAARYCCRYWSRER